MKCFVVLALALATANAGTLQDKYANAKPGYMRIPGWQKIQSGMKKLNQKEPTGTYVPRPEHTPKSIKNISIMYSICLTLIQSRGLWYP